MDGIELLLSCLLLSLAHGQVAINRSQEQQHVDQDRQHVASPLVQNISGGEEEEGASANVRPETWRDLLAINNVTNVSSFISLLVTRDGQPVREEDLFEPLENEDGKRVISASGELMADSDECSPRNMSVRLDLDLSDPEVAYYPECTKVERCGGCTPTPYLTCVPLYKEMIVLSVLKARYPFPGALSMEIVGFARVRVERHLTCRATCTLKEEDCGQHRDFLRNQCRCQCKRVIPCPNHKIWDEDLCQCSCRRSQLPCCAPGRDEDRRCPFYFDPVYCECTLKESVGGDPQASQAEMEAWLASRRGRQPNQLLSVTEAPNDVLTTTTQPPPTTPITTPGTTRASCSHLMCPRSMQRAMTASGRCLCQFPDNGRRRGDRRG